VCVLDRGTPGPLRPLAALSEAAWEAATRVLQADEARLVAGTAVSTRGSQVLGQGIGNMAHPVLEMETAGIAQVAVERGIALLSIRAISDGPRSPLPFDLEAVLDERYNYRMGRMAMVILRHPGILLRGRQLMQNTSIAADHAARALLAALRQPGPVIAR
jgi:nucleoside phosphorylase